MNTPPANWNAKAKQALNTHLWLILSLVANFFLVIFLYIATETLEVPTVPPSTVDNGLLIKTNVVVRHENFTWDQVESTNYVTFIKNLHAVGCPEQTIRDIIMSEVNRLVRVPAVGRGGLSQLSMVAFGTRRLGGAGGRRKARSS